MSKYCWAFVAGISRSYRFLCFCTELVRRPKLSSRPHLGAPGADRSAQIAGVSYARHHPFRFSRYKLVNLMLSLMVIRWGDRARFSGSFLKTIWADHIFPGGRQTAFLVSKSLWFRFQALQIIHSYLSLFLNRLVDQS